MSRLTKDNYTDDLFEKQKELIKIDEYHEIHYSQANYNEDLWNAVKEKEDLEEQLGCPLEKLIEFSKQETVYTKWGAFTNEIVLVDLNLGRIHITKNRDLNNMYLLYTSDYKKTWWLREDKS